MDLFIIIAFVLLPIIGAGLFFAGFYLGNQQTEILKKKKRTRKQNADVFSLIEE